MIFSIGHSNLAPAAFLERLRAFDIALVVDVRRQPRSRRHPHFERGALADYLGAAGIEYQWWGETLGGRRTPRADTPNIALDDPALRGYADHMLSPPFRDACAALVTLARARRCAVMCAEADYRHCHRQLLADHLQRAGLAVTHIVDAGRGEPHIFHAALGDAREPAVYNRRAQGDLFA
ncbi:MAG: DUF488 domain-containing protein [Proteobacteria bacterium]|nr:DUF488 domain-containing protein [Pseudomonadota bacterium]MBK8958409.1 DUF488 domain-containing protein [Pseudomonadota bacterium]